MREPQNICGIVVCGGQSTRMGKDKSMLVYHGLPQWAHMQHMLSDLCDGVYLSVNALQAAVLPQGLPLLEDLGAYRETGPMAALLTALHHLPGRNILLAGCDYPLLHLEELEHFLRFAAETPTAAAFYNEGERLYEPLLAFYPKTAGILAHQLFRSGNYSLQSLLRQLNARKYYPRDMNSVRSIDTPEQYEAALKITGSGTGFKKEG